MNQTELIYWLSFNSLFGFLFIFSAIMAYTVPLKWITYIVWASVISTMIGFYLNYTNPALIRRMGELTGSTLASVVYGSEETRNLSFFPHPNSAAFSVVCYFIFLFTTVTDRMRNIKFYLLSSVIMIGMVAITGSRTSLILSVILLFLYVRPLITRIINNKYKRNSGSIKLVLYSALAIGGVLGIFVLYLLSESTVSKGFSSVSSRFSIFNSLFDPSKDVKDESLDARTSIITVYIKYVSDSILFGYGPVFRDNKIDNGQFENVSQNAYLEGALVYGIIYPLYYFYINVKTYFISKKRLYKGHFMFNSLAVMMTFLFLLGFSVNDLFWNRAIVIVLGLLLGIYIRHRSDEHSNLQLVVDGNPEARIF